MSIINTKKPYLFLIIFIFLMGTNILGLILLTRAREKLNSVQGYIFWEDKLRKTGIPPTILKETGKIDEVFPNQDSVIQFISTINSYRGQFEKLSINFESEEPKIAKQKFLPLILEISGDSKMAEEFLKRLWNAPLVLEVTSLEIKKQAETPTKVALILKANLYVREAFEKK